MLTSHELPGGGRRRAGGGPRRRRRGQKLRQVRAAVRALAATCVRTDKEIDECAPEKPIERALDAFLGKGRGGAHGRSRRGAAGNRYGYNLRA